ncbi:MAG: hypothetical protein K9G43_08610 [Rhodobacteraceae bacterium]|nr:hypothetical protein [Paracoccaceae bacterium]
MTITFSTGDKPPVDLLAITEVWLRDAAETLAATVEDIKGGNHARHKEALECIKGLKQAVSTAIEEGNRVERLRKQIAGAAQSGALDLDAARDEIGRRLARLRDAGPD